MPSDSIKTISDRPDFIFVGEQPAIDFANTKVFAEGADKELLRSWVDVIEWLVAAKLSSRDALQLAGTRQAEALGHVIDFREEWKAALAKLVGGEPIADRCLGKLNAHLGKDAFHQRLERHGRAGFQLVRSESTLKGEALVLAILARHMAIFLAEADAAYLRRCANTASCVLYFYDTTKNHRRQWCSGATCGNRHKVAEFRKRKSKMKRRSG